MYSAKEDTVLDPFLGTGTTMTAAMASGRNSIGYEIDQGLREAILEGMNDIVSISNTWIRNRLYHHYQFISDRIRSKGPVKHQNQYYSFPVVTSQETDLIINELRSIHNKSECSHEVIYNDTPQASFKNSA
jgi:hypothetical protein